MTSEEKKATFEPSPSRRGVLLVNLGSPDSPTVRDVRRYLNQFLMDERVLDVPYLLRRIIVGLFILPFRPQKSAEAYSSIWWPEGSPLIVISERIQRKVQAKLPVPVVLECDMEILPSKRPSGNSAPAEWKKYSCCRCIPTTQCPPWKQWWWKQREC